MQLGSEPKSLCEATPTPLLSISSLIFRFSAIIYLFKIFNLWKSQGIIFGATQRHDFFCVCVSVLFFSLGFQMNFIHNWVKFRLL